MAEQVQIEEIWYKGQRVLRTGLQALVVGLPIFIAIVAAVQEQVAWPWVGSLFAVGVGLQALLSKIMAIPAVDAWLSARTPFGSVPKVVAKASAAEPESEPDYSAIEEPDYGSYDREPDVR